MRRITLVTLAALSLAACSNETTAPASADLALDAGAYGTELTLNGAYDATLYHDRLINALPDELKLTDEQKAKIRELVTEFQADTKADREALAAIFRQAREAAAAGKTREEIHAIIVTGAPIRARLHAAEKELVEDIHEVLTPEQRAWILAHRPPRCDPTQFPPLSEAQKDQIRALEADFRADNQADLEAMRLIIQEARAAFQAGKSREEIAAILAKQQVFLDGCRTRLIEPLEGILLQDLGVDVLAPTGLYRSFHLGRSPRGTGSRRSVPPAG